MKLRAHLALTALLCLPLAACSPVLERRDLASERIGTQKYANNVTYIEVRGLTAVEDMGVAITSTERIGDDIYMKVKLGWAADGCQPFILERVPILTGNERIFFGHEKILIWPRPTEPLPAVISDMKEVKVVERTGPGK